MSLGDINTEAVDSASSSSSSSATSVIDVPASAAMADVNAGSPHTTHSDSFLSAVSDG